MKTIKQIREEYNSKFLYQDLPEEIMLDEAEGNPFSNRVPSSKEMPIMLIFKRVQFRAFPDKTTVAMYYCKALNKYLTIPFGPKGNVNLGEATLIDADMLNEDWQETNRKDNTSGMSQKAVNAYRREHPGSKLQTAVTEKNPSGKRAARRKSFCSRMGGMKKRLTSAKTANDPDSRINKALRRWRCEEAFKIKLEEKRQERLDEFLSTALKVAGRWALKKALSPSKKPQQGQQASSSEVQTYDKERPQGKVKAFAASDLAKNRSTDAARSIESQAAKKYAKSQLSTQQQVQENKIADLRKLIGENATMDLLINGRTIQLNSNMAKRIVEVYDSVNNKNKKIVESMLNEDLESFKKLLNFSIKV